MVERNTPASRAPIYRNDILLSINDVPIQHPLQLGDQIRKNVGKTVKLELLRNTKKVMIDVKLNDKSF